MRIPLKPPRWRCARHNRYFGALYNATPKWLSAEQRKAYYAIMREAKQRRRGGERVEVDHIVPMLHPLVCGLNVPWNLRIVPAKINQRKSNNYWPDMPHAIEDMFSCRETVEPYQRTLNF